MALRDEDTEEARARLSREWISTWKALVLEIRGLRSDVRGLREDLRGLRGNLGGVSILKSVASLFASGNKTR